MTSTAGANSDFMLTSDAVNMMLYSNMKIGCSYKDFKSTAAVNMNSPAVLVKGLGYFEK